MIDNFINIYGGYHNKFKKTKLYLYEMSNISISTNNNFIKSLLIPITGSNTVSVGIFINAGSRQETEAYGIAHFLEHMTFKGTNKRTSDRLMIDLDSIGANYNAMTGHEFTLYYISGDPRDILLLLDIVIDLYLNPLYPDKDIENERNVVIEELRMNEDNNHKVLSKMMYKNIFQNVDKSLARPIIGFKKSIEVFNKNNILNFRKKNYIGSNCLLCVCGNFDKREIVKHISSLFDAELVKKHLSSNIFRNNMKENEKITNLMDLNPDIKKYIHYDKTINQTIINFCFNSYDTYNKNSDAVDLICDVLSNGFSSRLFNLLRNKMGVSYYNNSYNRTFSDWGIMFISVGVDHNSVVETIKEILNELKTLKENGITNDELSKVKKQNETGLLFQFKDPYEYLMYYGMNYLVNKPLYNLSDMLDNIDSIKLNQINSIIARIFNSKNITIGTIGKVSIADTNKIEKLIEDF